MYSPVLSVPAPRATAWVAETDPRYARAWLEALPLADSAESAREIYQALYTLNRQDLRLQVRFELMGLYDRAVAAVCNGLAPHLAQALPPLPPKKRQLAEFMRRLHVEMAYGYKCCLRDLSRARLSLRRKSRSAACIERALYHSTEVLLRSYLVYLPYPGGVWREMHELYRLTERLGALDEPMQAAESGVPDTVTIGERYVRALLLGLLDPYQLPHNAVQQAHAFLARWAPHARVLGADAARALGEATACFAVDLDADAPPVPLARGVPKAATALRVLDARALLLALQGFVARLQQGEPAEALGLGIECLDSVCLDLLTRMARAWGEVGRRRYARRQRSSSLFVCIGLDALHFYASGKRSFAQYAEGCIDSGRTHAAGVVPETPNAESAAPETPEGEGRAAGAMHRIDRWRLRDIGPQGMSVACYGEAALPTRVGELIGVQQPSDRGRWRPAVVRWVRSPEANSIEAGLELLAPAAAVAAARFPDASAGRTSELFPALRLPATEVSQRPPTLLVPRGRCQVGDVIELLDEEAEPRQVRLLRVIERTGAFDQMVYGEIAKGLRRRR